MSHFLQLEAAGLVCESVKTEFHAQPYVISLISVRAAYALLMIMTYYIMKT